MIKRFLSTDDLIMMILTVASFVLLRVVKYFLLNITGGPVYEQKNNNNCRTENNNLFKGNYFDSRTSEIMTFLFNTTQSDSDMKESSIQ